MLFATACEAFTTTIEPFGGISCQCNSEQVECKASSCNGKKFVEKMTRPIGLFLRETRIRSRKTQKEFAYELALSQAELSALELGSRKPTDALLSRLDDLVGLNEEEKVEMKEALEASEHRITLPVDASSETYQFFNALRRKIDRLHPAVLDARFSILMIEEQITNRTRPPPKRMRRRQHKEAPM